MTDNRPVFAVVMPAYNVGSLVARAIAGLPDWLDIVIVVDDASHDDTAARVEAVADPRVRLIRHPVNGGVGAAMKTGYREALRLGADVVIKMDGDDQMDPEYLVDLVAPIVRGQADYTKGNRFRNKKALRSMPFLRRTGNLTLSFLNKLASGYWNIFDPTNGYTAIRREVLASLVLDEVADRYFFEISMLVQLNLTNACVKDVPMPSRYGDETSTLRIGKVLRSFPSRLVRAFLRRIWNKYFVYDFTAVSIFLVSGVPLIAVGGFNGVWYWSQSFATRQPATAGQVMLSVLPLMVGFQLLLQAFVLDIHSVPQVSLHDPMPWPDEPARRLRAAGATSERGAA